MVDYIICSKNTKESLCTHTNGLDTYFIHQLKNNTEQYIFCFILLLWTLCIPAGECWGFCPKLRIDWFCVFKQINFSVEAFCSGTLIVILWSFSKGCNRLHTRDGLHSLAPQWYWEDSVSSVLQMEGSGSWTLQACSGDYFLHVMF